MKNVPPSPPTPVHLYTWGGIIAPTVAAPTVLTWIRALRYLGLEHIKSDKILPPYSQTFPQLPHTG